MLFTSFISLAQDTSRTASELSLASIRSIAKYFHCLYSFLLNLLSQLNTISKHLHLIPEKSEWPKPLRVLVFDIPLTWTKAGEFCHSKGGSLLILDDKSIIPEANVTSPKTYGNSKSHNRLILVSNLVSNIFTSVRHL